MHLETDDFVTGWCSSSIIHILKHRDNVNASKSKIQIWWVLCKLNENIERFWLEYSPRHGVSSLPDHRGRDFQGSSCADPTGQGETCDLPFSLQVSLLLIYFALNPRILAIFEFMELRFQHLKSDVLHTGPQQCLSAKNLPTELNSHQCNRCLFAGSGLLHPCLQGQASIKKYFGIIWL